MATKPRLPIGSAPWIVIERKQINDLVVQESEEFSFYVRNEFEWLNEHMAEIFVPGNLNVINIFKTPGKLRGRTPYTIKKRPNPQSREPLADIFAPNPQSYTAKSPVKASTLQFKINNDTENQHVYKLLSPPKPSTHLLAPSSPGTNRLNFHLPKACAQLQPDTNTSDNPQTCETGVSEVCTTTDETFLSAKETQNNSQIPSDEVLLHINPNINSTVNNLEADVQSFAEDVDLDHCSSPSLTSSPLKPTVIRKSSLTFAALPAREPLAKSSFGPRSSHLDASKGRPSHLGRTTGSRATNGPAQLTLDREELETTKLHNQTSTQRLHDKINLLGQARERDSKHQSTYSTQILQVVGDGDDDNWIQPHSQTAAPNDAVLAQHPSSPIIENVASIPQLPLPQKSEAAPELKKASVSNPSSHLVLNSTTPMQSPPPSPSNRRVLENHISASKAKFYSVLKSAKGIFASSAGASANAKMEVLSSSPRKNDIQSKRALFPDVQSQNLPAPDGRCTRSSTEQKRKASDELDKARELEQISAVAAKKMNPARAPANLVGLVSTKEASGDAPPPPPKTTQAAHRPQSQRRVPIPRLNKEAPKAKPVTIRMPSQRIGHVAPNITTLNQSISENFPPVPPPKPTLNTKNFGLTTHPNSSSASLKGINNAAKRAVDAAQKKKEQDAKALQRKLDQKREMEQKRAQRLEDERKLEQQRKVAEQKRAQEARAAAQKQIDDFKKPLEQKKIERPGSRQNNVVNAFSHEQKAHPSTQRGDISGAKFTTNVTLTQGPPRIQVQINPAKPPKRAMQFDDEPAKPASAAYQQQDAKRRKTGEEEKEEEKEKPETRSVMPPPVRQSSIQKQPSKFSHSITNGHANNSNNPSILVKTVTSQLAKSITNQHNEMAKYAHGHIPFANTTPSNAFNSQKSPARHILSSAVKSSPQFPPSESIHLPEIPTDSEDEDDDSNASPFRAPSWTLSPALRAALERQQLVDPQSIFGPVGPLRMDEVFRRGGANSNVDRVKKFRERTSSANWTGTDRLTQEERVKDRKAREVLMKDGGWDMRRQREAMGSPYPVKK